MPKACYLLHGKHIGPSRERSETGCFTEPVPRGSREPSRGSFLRFFDGFGSSVGIRFASMGPSIFVHLFGYLSRTAVDELCCNGGRTRGGQAGEGDSLSGTSLERIGAVTKPYAKRQAFGLARRIHRRTAPSPPPCHVVTPVQLPNACRCFQ